MRHAGLFEGIGGLTIAAERAGMETVWSSEIDKHASAVLDHHWPDIPNYGDIHGITDAPRVDVLTGGFPCQDYSVAGRGAGLAGDRGALWWQFHRLIAELNPRWVIAENVDGLTNRTHRGSLRTIIGSLVSLGYGVVWRVFDARHFGVAQKRQRVFIVGHSGGQPRPEVLALAQGVSGDSPPRREAGQTLAPTVAARTRGGGYPGTDEALNGALVASSLTAAANYDQAGNESWLVADTLRPHPRPGSATVGAIAATLTQGAPNAGRRAEDDVNLVAYGIQGDGSSALGSNGRGWSKELGFTLTSRDKHAVATASVRRLTPLECERLQGFPDGWTDIPGNSDTQRYRQLGNAVAVPVAEWIMRRVAAA